MAKKKIEQPIIQENIIFGPLDQLMGDKFAIYAKDVIQDRAIPDARDGLKPVQRRIVYDMWNTGNTIEKPTKKCARIVGDVLGKYHPHGDSSVYDALVHMSQDWNVRYPLIDFQGNNGSMDGDSAAAYRYTEARLSAISNELIADIDKDTVDMELTFDDTLFEPTVLPALFPNLLANGSEGIAVGISTSIPPHNLREITSAVVYRIKHPECSVDDLMRFVPGPDFPTGGIIYKSSSLEDIYRKGRGKVTVSSKAEIVTDDKGASQIIVSEIPFHVNKSVLVKAIDKICHDKTIPGILEVRDESDKEGLRISIDLKNDCKPEAVLAYLMNKTQLKTSISAQVVAIVDDKPKTLDLLSYCDCYIQHQLDVITRKSHFLLNKYTARLEIVQGLIKAISILDKVVEVIRSSQDKADSKANIQREFGFTEPQAEAIVMMPLYKLSHTDIKVLEDENVKLNQDIDYLNGLLSDQSKREDVIIDNLKTIAKKYSGERLTEIREEETSTTLDKRDLIARETVKLVITRDGYIKRSSIKSWKGSGGQNGAKAGIKTGDSFVFDGECDTTDFLLIFTEQGNYLYVPVNEVKEAKWNDEGYHVNNLVNLTPNDHLIAAFAVRHFRHDLFVVLLSRNGSIKRIRFDSFPVVRRSKPISAIKLEKGDSLVGVTYTTGNSNLFITSEDGRASFYNENEIYISNPKSRGMKAGSFSGKPLAGVLAFNQEEKENKILVITDRGSTRVFDTNHITLGKRLAKANPFFNMFKKEPHRVVFITRTNGQVPPYTIETVLHDDNRYDIIFPDFYLTPTDRYAKRPDNFPAKDRIEYISRDNSNSFLIDDSIQSFEPALPPIEEEQKETPIQKEEEKPVVYEEISLFDDILSFEDDKKE
ncbi:MAG: DNA topoisomerase 4 subunit A [Bacilli bacterium]|nr:DNA topoisomerase 4 subunit A [Bacilli bacterium]